MDEFEVGVGAGPTSLHPAIALIEGDAVGEDQVRDADGGRTRDALHAVHVKFTALVAAVCHELDGVVEAAGDILVNVVLQVVALVHNALVLVVVLAVVSCAVDNVRDSDVLEHLRVPSDKITAQVQVVVNDLGADALVELVLVLFA